MKVRVVWQNRACIPVQLHIDVIQRSGCFWARTCVLQLATESSFSAHFTHSHGPPGFCWPLSLRPGQSGFPHTMPLHRHVAKTLPHTPHPACTTSLGLVSSSSWACGDSRASAWSLLEPGHIIPEPGIFLFSGCWVVSQIFS